MLDEVAKLINSGTSDESEEVPETICLMAMESGVSETKTPTSSIKKLFENEFEFEQEEGEEETSAEEELFECFVKCDRNERELSKCEEKCVKSYQEKKREEREERGGGSGGGGGGGGGGGSTEDNHHHDPVQEYKQCQSRCGIQEFGEQRQLCQQKCQLQYGERKREQSKEHGGGSDVINPRKEQETRNNPYFFDSQRFDSKYKTEEGHIKVLERFSKRSELLRGIENYRLAVLEANPNTFVVPHHKDAESVFVVLGGSMVYLINRDDDERLYILELLQPVNTPGRFKEYFGVGGGNPESYYRAFSNEILEAAFNYGLICKTKLVFVLVNKYIVAESCLGSKGEARKAFWSAAEGSNNQSLKQQIKALTKESKSSKERKEESWGPFNLLDEHPLFSSRYGKFYEANPSNYDQLKDLDVSVAFMNIKKGGMIAPYYNSKSTRLVFVVGGSGQFEMACPHIASQSQWRKERQETRSDVHYEKVSARLSVGDAFIIPAGHPISIISSKDSKLQLAGFGIKASFNQKYFLAGRENVWNIVESEAKELSFGLPASEVEEIFRSQEESYFLSGPGQKEEGRKEHSVASIFDFVGF
ncbi:hypothetical protein RD792_017372 [Penstemon davidsonii]|uniref:Cupin type-1 domain-containing protein n=1 Tax=Penstemon davidsonii TaxID=160366 RepID=A0ABR0CLW0_9LAMI|nr:hypothetical protein RD792_017372 [Penstemon davidsonii]